MDAIFIFCEAFRPVIKVRDYFNWKKSSCITLLPMRLQKQVEVRGFSACLIHNLRPEYH